MQLLEFGGFPPQHQRHQQQGGQLSVQLDSFKGEPLIGLEFILEITSSSSANSKFVCLLCDKENYSSSDEILQDVLGSEHRLRYVVS